MKHLSLKILSYEIIVTVLCKQKIITCYQTSWKVKSFKIQNLRYKKWSENVFKVIYLLAYFLLLLNKGQPMNGLLCLLLVLYLCKGQIGNKNYRNNYNIIIIFSTFQKSNKISLTILSRKKFQTL